MKKNAKSKVVSKKVEARKASRPIATTAPKKTRVRAKKVLDSSVVKVIQDVATQDPKAEEQASIEVANVTRKVWSNADLVVVHQSSLATRAIRYVKNHVVHFLHHAPYCIIMCTAYHMLDAYYSLTLRLMWTLGLTFAPPH